jgi:hypothetical protein
MAALPRSGRGDAPAALYSEIGGHRSFDREVQDADAPKRRGRPRKADLAAQMPQGKSSRARMIVTHGSARRLPESGGGNASAAANAEFGAKAELTFESSSALPQSGGGSPSSAPDAEIGGHRFRDREVQSKPAPKRRKQRSAVASAALMREIAESGGRPKFDRLVHKAGATSARGRRLVGAPASPAPVFQFEAATQPVPGRAIGNLPLHRRVGRIVARPGGLSSKLRATGGMTFGSIRHLPASNGRCPARRPLRLLSKNPEPRS